MFPRYSSVMAFGVHMPSHDFLPEMLISEVHVHVWTSAARLPFPRVQQRAGCPVVEPGGLLSHYGLAGHLGGLQPAAGINSIVASLSLLHLITRRLDV